MSNVVDLTESMALCLLCTDDEQRAGVGEHAVPSFDHELLTATTAQKIYYAPGSVAQSMVLRDAFAALDEDAPTAAQARGVYERIATELPDYELHVDGELWWIRNRTAPRFGDPFVGRSFGLHVRGRSGAWHRLPLAGDEVDDAFRLVPWLCGERSLDEVIEQVGSSPARAQLLRGLARVEAIEQRPARRQPALDELPRVLFLGHSAVFVHDGSHSVIIDPVVRSSTQRKAPRERRPFELIARADAVLLTHNHWDHFFYETLVTIPRDKLVVVPRVRQPTFANPPLAAYLRALGFTNVRECDPWDVVQVGELRVDIVPFFGEPAGLGSRFDAFTYLIEFGGKRLYGSLDACHDEAGTMEPVIAEVAARGPIDVFLFGASNLHHHPIYPAARVRHFSNELLTRPDLVRYHPNCDDVARWSAMLRPRFAIPYAEFIFDGSPAPDLDLGDAPGDTFERYWAAHRALHHGIADSLAAWHRDLTGLRGRIDAELVMLEPMQGITRA
jgi:hypothetical protein